MVKAIVEIGKEANKLLNHLKAEYNLKDKSQAINLMAHEFKRFVRTEPEVRPEYMKKLIKISKGPHTKAISVKEFRKLYGLK